MGFTKTRIKAYSSNDTTYLCAFTRYYNSGYIICNGQITGVFEAPTPDRPLSELTEIFPDAAQIKVPKLGDVLLVHLFKKPIEVDDYINRKRAWDADRLKYMDAKADTLTAEGRKFIEKHPDGSSYCEAGVGYPPDRAEGERYALEKILTERHFDGFNHDEFMLHTPEMTGALESLLKTKGSGTPNARG